MATRRSINENRVSATRTGSATGPASATRIGSTPRINSLTRRSLRESSTNIPVELPTRRSANEGDAPRRYPSPEPRIKDPTLMSIPSTSKILLPSKPPPAPEQNPSGVKKLMTYCYNTNENTFCERTCTNWFLIIGYAILYIIFLCTYTLIFLYMSLWIIKANEVYKSDTDKTLMLSYAQYGVGLTITPTFDTTYPLIAYRRTFPKDYEKYVKSIDQFLDKKRRKRDTSLGPCGESPYGYGDEPCIIIRINKQFGWAGKPLEVDSKGAKNAPKEVQNWIKQDKMLWLYCEGLESHDKEHIGRIKYFPHPPAFDPKEYPIKVGSNPSVVALQLTNFTIGLTLHVECKLWYRSGPSKIHFMIYVAPDDRPITNI